MNKCTAIFLSLLSSVAILHAQSRVQPQKGIDQGYEVKSTEMMGGYNSPARIDIDGSWDTYVTGSFLYWNARTNGFPIGVTHPQRNAVVPPFAVFPNPDGQVLDLKFDYEPGFKVGFGIDFQNDNWTVFAEYVRLKVLDNTHTFAPQPSGWILPSFFRTDNIGFADEVTMTWKMNYNVVNLEIGRPCYVGRFLIFKPHFGAQGNHIKESLQNIAVIGTAAGTLRVLRSLTTQDAWAVGLRAGLDTKWLLGLGIRLFGDIATNLLYTDYTVRQKQSDATSEDLFSTAYAVKNELSTIQPNLEIGLGFGWGTYIGQNKWHVDLSAGYDFIVYWNHNMMSHTMAEFVRTQSQSIPSLFMHGLTATGRLDF